MCSPRMMIDIRAAVFPDDREAVQALLREYADTLGIDLAFQRFDDEVAGLPGRFAPPDGRLLVATDHGRIVGCIALRAVDGERCEMKRLYVRPQTRGTGLGRRLAEAICAEARAAGYRSMVLDTLPTMAAAQAVYRALGFGATTPYVFNPIPGTRYLALDLTRQN